MLQFSAAMQAVVEADEQVTFFYLCPAEGLDFETKSVWVRNHIPAPRTLDAARMKAGLPPANPAEHCRHKQGAPPLSRDDLQVAWLPEGNGAALYERDDLLAMACSAGPCTAPVSSAARWRSSKPGQPLATY